MNKKIFFLAASAIAMASCSTEEVVDFNAGDTICFRASVDHTATTRGLEVSNTNLKAFYVTALEDMMPDDDTNNLYTTFFENLLFTKKDKESTEFVSNPEYQWSNKLSLKFFAYGYYATGDMEKPLPGSVFGDELTLTGDQQTINGFSPQPEFADQIDLITAVAESKKTALNATVGLNFRHILSEVSVQAKCDSKAHRILVKAVKLGNIDNNGNYDFSTNQWTVNKSKTSYMLWQNPEDHNSSITLSATETDLTKSGTIGYAMLLPQTLTTWSSSNEGFYDESYTGGSGKIRTSAQYIAVLIKILALNPETGEVENQDAVKFPLQEEHKFDSDGFGWAYIPLHVDKCPSWGMGNRYVYHLNFSNGAGYNEDGEQILNAKIQFSADVKEWATIDIYKPGDNVVAEETNN